MDAFPNDFYCIRLLHNIEIWIILVTFIQSSTNLPKIMEDLRSFGQSQPQSGISGGPIWLQQYLKSNDRSSFFHLRTFQELEKITRQKSPPNGFLPHHNDMSRHLRVRITSPTNNRHRLPESFAGNGTRNYNFLY